MKRKIYLLGSLLVLCALASFLLFSSFSPQDTPARYASMKTFEYAAVFDSKIVIVYENGQIEEIELEKAKKQDNIISNLRKINETINALSKKGYRLVSSSGEMTFMSYVFEKR